MSFSLRKSRLPSRSISPIRQPATRIRATQVPPPVVVMTPLPRVPDGAALDMARLDGSQADATICATQVPSPVVVETQLAHAGDGDAVETSTRDPLEAVAAPRIFHDALPPLIDCVSHDGAAAREAFHEARWQERAASQMSSKMRSKSVVFP